MDLKKSLLVTYVLKKKKKQIHGEIFYWSEQHVRKGKYMQNLLMHQLFRVQEENNRDWSIRRLIMTPSQNMVVRNESSSWVAMEKHDLCDTLIDV